MLPMRPHQPRSNGRASRETVPGQFYIINGKKTMVNSVIRDTDF